MGSIRARCQELLGNQWAEIYAELIVKKLTAYDFMGAKCRMSLKKNVLHSHLDFFPPIWEMHGSNVHGAGASNNLHVKNDA